VITASDPSRERWNRRWAGEERVHASTAPSRFVVAEVADLPPGAALDLACGAGRNAVWLAEQGWRVTAVDFSGVALRMARSLEAERRTALARAAAAVRPGGTLLVLGHDLLNLTDGWGGPTQADVLFTPDDVVAEIGDLRIEKAERVRRAVDEPGASREAIDALVRATRVS
jgi:SAM-dependent methyltransferase